MAGKKITRLRNMIEVTELELQKAKGTPDETFAVNRLKALKDELADELARRKKVGGKHPREKVPWNMSKQSVCATVKQAADEKKAAAVRLVGRKAVTDVSSGDIAAEAGITAAEIAVAGVRKDFALVRKGDVEPLSDEEFANARDIVSTVSDGENNALAKTDDTMERGLWLAKAFPSLSENRRVKCARFLSCMATMAACSPNEDAPDGMTVMENALESAGMTYIEFETARKEDFLFDAAQAAVKEARKRCIMDRLEETLQYRAMFGQMEETVDRFGQRHEARHIDNTLAFNLLKYGHEQYLRRNIKDKAVAAGMTLMIASGKYPESPKMAQPAKPGVIDV